MHGRKFVIQVGLVVGAILLCVSFARASTLSWTPPTQAIDTTDNTVVTLTSAEIAQIVYIPYTGPSSAGPWTAQPATTPGATSATVPTPAKGETMWYTVAGRLGGEGGKASPVSLSVSAPILAPSAPTNVKVVK